MHLVRGPLGTAADCLDCCAYIKVAANLNRSTVTESLESRLLVKKGSLVAVTELLVERLEDFVHV